MIFEGKRRDRRPLGRAATGSFCALLTLLILPACDPPAPPAPPGIDLPAAYVGGARGEVEVDGLTFFGRARVDYLVWPSGEVDVTRLRFWVDDADIVVRGPLGRERRREALRCTRFELDTPAKARTGAAGRLAVVAGDASVTGVSFADRDLDGTCPGLARLITATNNADFEIEHDPVADKFGLSASFTGTFDGDTVSIDLAMDGSFVNRPPDALIGVGGPGLPPGSIQGGCPPIVAGNPPYTPANDPAGLRVSLLSLTSDRDGQTSRSDVSREHWLHSADGGPLRAIGTEQLIGPVLFPTGTQNRLVLEASDRHGARTRTLCDFLVLDPGGGS